ncbi:MAG: endonuclease [Schlesneria sp.]|nr:endonuclease [Schlesneria sp.]
MIACLDVYYSQDKAHAAAVVFSDWADTSSLAEYEATVDELAPYQPGQFYLRELPPLLAVIAKIAESVDTYVLDGYCHLSADSAPGLGEHLRASLHQPVIIIGVAKNRYQQTEHAAQLCRGQSVRPLFITAIGIDYDAAARLIGSMAGEFRMPTLIKAADALSRKVAEDGPIGGNLEGDSRTSAAEECD